MTVAQEMLELADWFDSATSVQITLEYTDGNGRRHISSFPIDSTAENPKAKLVAIALRESALSRNEVGGERMI